MGKRIKALRIRAGLTQQSTADSLGMTIRAYQKYEEDASEPSLHSLISLSIMFDVSTDQLLGLEPVDSAGE